VISKFYIMVPLSSVWLYQTHTCFHNVVHVRTFIIRF